MKMAMNDDMLKRYSYISISSYRVRTLKALEGCEVKTPTNIAADAGIRPNHISKVLKELKEVGAAECINEGAKKGRLYRLTDAGETIAENLK